jgi:glycosyltransferase involved in cell wall biosynthesis
MKVLYLLNRVQRDRIQDIKRGENDDNHLYGMLRLPKYGVDADYLEIEQYFPERLAGFLRKHILNIHWVHAPLFLRFFSYDAVISSMSFGSQLIHTLYPFRKPKWIMLDFTVTGLLGAEKTVKQKILAYMVARAAGVVTIDAHEKSVLEKRFPSLQGKVQFIRFAADTEFFKPRRVSEEEKLIFSPGRDPGRDFKTFFQAIQGLGARVVLTARQGTIDKLLPLPPSVANANLTVEEYVAMLARASIIVIPLDTRGGLNNAMGISTLVEAMAMGKAIIATRTPSVESYIEHGRTGILVTACSPVALQEAISRLLSDTRTRIRLGEEARTFAVANCAADRFAFALAAYLKKTV